MVPFLSITSERAKIGIESQKGHFEIRRPQPDIRVESRKPEITANNQPGVLNIDQSRTGDALNGGKPEAFWRRIYSQYKEIGQQSVAQIVERGNRMGDLRVKGNPIAEMALEEFIEGAPDLQIYGFASLDNVHFEYIPNDLNLQVVPGGVNMDVQVGRPEIYFNRGSVKVYMEQYPKVSITPPTINLLA